jgi:nucleoside-diphosphate-sugar epimerase
MQNKVISVFGGTGFLGNYVVNSLLKSGAAIRILSRNPTKALPLKINAKLGQLSLVYTNILDVESINDAIAGSDTVINLVGSRSSSKKELFLTNVLFPKVLAKCVRQQKIPHLIHFSTIGVENTYESNYAHSKYEGDQYLLHECKNAIILRPGLAFGLNDHFIYKLYFLMSRMPFFIATNLNKTIKPVYAGDIAQIVINILQNYKQYQGHTFNITGTKEYSLSTIMLALSKGIGKKINIITLKKSTYTLYLTLLSKILPKPLMDKEYTHLLFYNYDRAPRNILKEIQIDSKDLEQFILSGLKEKA